MRGFAFLFAVVLSISLLPEAQSAALHGAQNFASVNRAVQERSVKIYGAGGLEQLEAYQSGFLISKEGHIATVSSLVLDRDEATVLLADGRRYTAVVVGTDPVTEIALLKIEADEEGLPYFQLDSASIAPREGQRILAFSNLYNVATGDEPVSVLQGVIAAIAPLQARRGAFSTRYRGEVLVLDAPTNNPGAAGGVLVDFQGKLLGMLGKEVRSELTGTWLNYALPLPQVAESLERIRSGQLPPAGSLSDEFPESPATFASLGFRLVPNVVSRTPPYVDEVISDSPAAKGGMRPDDLVVAIGPTVISSCQEATRALRRVPDDQPVTISLLRGDRLLEVELTPPVSHEEIRP